MTSARYRLGDRWFKGNTHIHSTVSDGGKTFAQLERMYAAKGYDFLFRTDHWHASDVRAGAQGGKLLWMDGIELDGQDQTGAAFHIIGLGTFRGIDRAAGLEKGIEAIRAQGGLLIMAHPFWMANTPDDVRRWRFDGVEVYNHICQWMNGKGDGLVHWHVALAQNPRTLALAVDDAHIIPEHPGWNGAWVMVNAAACAPEAILEALRDGRFYSTCGPELKSIECRDGKVLVQTSPVRVIRLVGPATHGRCVGAFHGKLMTGATFDVPSDWPFAYLEVEDSHGRRAWTNAL